jgi:hypothetical protein
MVRRTVWEHAFAMTSDGHVYGRFKRALTNRHLLQAMAEARDIPHVPLVDALALCLLMDQHDDDRYERAAARWVGRFALECRRAELHDIRRALDAFDAMPDPAARQSLEELAVMATR